MMGQIIPEPAPKLSMEAHLNGLSKMSQTSSNFTERVIAATGPNAHPRLKEIIPSLVRHLHDFAREVKLTVGEWEAAVEFVSFPSAHGLVCIQQTCSLTVDTAQRMWQDVQRPTQ